jgi:hypothetical protein
MQGKQFGDSNKMLARPNSRFYRFFVDIHKISTSSMHNLEANDLS